jgi:hypothetical protein
MYVGPTFLWSWVAASCKPVAAIPKNWFILLKSSRHQEVKIVFDRLDIRSSALYYLADKILGARKGIKGKLV